MAGAVYWVAKFQPGAPGRGAGPAHGAVQAGFATPAVRADAALVARALGASGQVTGAAAASVSAPATGRLALIGVVAERPVGTSSRAAAQVGAALIAVDGKPARPYRVGSEIEPGLVLLSVGERQARLGPSRSAPATQILEMPAPKR